MGGNPALRALWPTKQEMKDLLAEHGTYKAVARALGRPYTTVVHIGKALGIEQNKPQAQAFPPGHVRFGWDGEEHAALLLGAELARNQTTRDSPYDLLWNGQRIEVKTARPSGRPPNAWLFRTDKNGREGQSDYYFCVGCSPDGAPQTYFLLPTSDVPGEMLKIPLSLRSKWAKYEWKSPTSAKLLG